MTAYPRQVAYSKARRDWARANQHCQQCHKQPARIVDGVVKSQCQECYEAQCKRLGREPHGQVGLVAYQPVDEILERKSVRLLRAIQWFDGVSCADLLDALDVDEDNGRDTWRVRFRQLNQRGLICGEAWGLYRITPAGRAWLAKQLARADVGVATEEEAA